MSKFTGKTAKVPTTDDEWAKALGRAVDEIYALRVIAANEARILEAHLDLKSFPKSRRQFAVEQVEKLRKAARGEVEAVYATYKRPKNELRNAGADEGLTNWQWLEQAGFTEPTSIQ